MVDAAVKIVDRLIQLLSLQERNREKYFQNFVDPLFHDAELVVHDYIALFRELISQLEKGDSVSEIVKWLEERRLELLPVRIKLRAFLTHMSYDRQRKLEASMDRFQKGIWGLMKGGLSLVEEGHSQLSEYGWQDHTVLDLLYLWSQQPIAENRSRYIANAKAQLACIEEAWKDVSEGYARLKISLV